MKLPLESAGRTLALGNIDGLRVFLRRKGSWGEHATSTGHSVERKGEEKSVKGPTSA